MTDPCPKPARLPAPPDNDDGPVFEEPWQAQAFALAVHLSETGHFSWHEWSTALGEEIQAAEARGDRHPNYYQHWLSRS